MKRESRSADSADGFSFLKKNEELNEQIEKNDNIKM